MIDKESRETIEGLMKKYLCSESALLPALCMVQKKNRYISESDMEELSGIMNLPQSRIFSTASFYSMLSFKPRGRYHFQVCTNITCSLADREPLFDYVSHKLGINGGGTTDDGLFSLEAVECIGACGDAPAIIVNSDYYENMSFKKIDALIKQFKKNDKCQSSNAQ